MRMLMVIAAATTLTATVGCVPKKQYVELEGQYQTSLDEGASQQEQIAQLEADINDLRSKAMQMDNDARDLRGQLDDAISDKAALIDERSDLEASVEEMETALVELARRQVAAEGRIAAFKDLLSRFQELIDAGRLRVKIVDGQMVVELPTDILFASGSASLSKEGEEAILDVAEVLADIPDRKFQVGGHTDNVPIATAQYPSNWELASARSITVVKTLIDGGVWAERVSGTSYGETQPIADNESDESRKKNRRIEIMVVPDLSGLPGYDELSNAVADDE